LAEELTPEDGFVGTFLEGARMFSEKLDPNFIPTKELI